MTSHESFPGRPRGRRARHGNELPGWQGRDATPDDEREFPDLEPIRGRRLTQADNRDLPDAGGRGRHSAGQPAGGWDGAGPDIAPPWGGQPQPPQAQPPQAQPPLAQPSQGPVPGYGPQFGGQPEPYAAQQPGGQQYDAPQYGGQQHEAPQPGGQQYGGQHYDAPQYEAPQYGGQRQPAQQYAGQQYAGPQPPAGGPAAPGRFARRRPQRAQQRPARQPGAEQDDELTDDPMEAFSQRWARRGTEDPSGGGKRKRLMLIGGGGALAVIVAVIAYFSFGPGSSSGSPNFGSLVTTFLPGEIQKVPDACKVVSPATLRQYLSGSQPQIAAPPLNGGADSQCTWTLDSTPTYRVIEVDISAFSPSGLASGDGSATFAAIDAYANDLQVMQKPAANSGQPAAKTTDIAGLGTAAFGATQVFKGNGAITDKATVIVRYHNVLVTAVVNGLQHAVTKKGTYGPVSMSTLSAAARQVAAEAIAQLRS